MSTGYLNWKQPPNLQAPANEMRAATPCLTFAPSMFGRGWSLEWSVLSVSVRRLASETKNRDEVNFFVSGSSASRKPTLLAFEPILLISMPPATEPART
jgi:hypothetical protein